MWISAIGCSLSSVRTAERAAATSSRGPLSVLNDDEELVEGILRERRVHLRADFRGEAAVLHIGHHADDLPRRPIGIPENGGIQADALANRILARKEAARQGLADDGHPRRSCRVSLVEITPAPKLHSDNSQVMRLHGKAVHERAFALSNGTTLDVHIEGKAIEQRIAVQGQRQDRARCVHARDGFQSFLELPEEVAGLPGVVFFVRQAHPEREDVARIDSRIDSAETPEALDEQRGSRQQDEREGYLAHDQRTAQPAGARTFRMRAPRVSKRARQIDS